MRKTLGRLRRLTESSPLLIVIGARVKFGGPKKEKPVWSSNSLRVMKKQPSVKEY